MTPTAKIEAGQRWTRGEWECRIMSRDKYGFACDWHYRQDSAKWSTSWTHKACLPLILDGWTLADGTPAQQETTMTPETLNELERLEREATPAPWFKDTCQVCCGVSQGTSYRDRGVMITEDDTNANADLIYKMRNALPVLLAAARLSLSPTPTGETPPRPFTITDPEKAARSWPEDFLHENGQYLCRCVKCGHDFIGHKRRVVCKVCFGKPASGEVIKSELAALRERVEAATAGPVTGEFSKRNRLRCESPSGFNHQLDSWSLSDWMTAVVGEIGEAANIVKKLNRIRDGIPGNKETEAELRANLADELADAEIYLDLLFQSVSINREAAIESKFAKTSAKIGYQDADHINAALPKPQGDNIAGQVNSQIAARAMREAGVSEDNIGIVLGVLPCINAALDRFAGWGEYFDKLEGLCSFAGMDLISGKNRGDTILDFIRSLADKAKGKPQGRLSVEEVAKMLTEANDQLTSINRYGTIGLREVPRILTPLLNAALDRKGSSNKNPVWRHFAGDPIQQEQATKLARLTNGVVEPVTWPVKDILIESAASWLGVSVATLMDAVEGGEGPKETIAEQAERIGVKARAAAWVSVSELICDLGFKGPPDLPAILDFISELAASAKGWEKTANSFSNVGNAVRAELHKVQQASRQLLDALRPVRVPEEFQGPVYTAWKMLESLVPQGGEGPK